jgi:hypothetical protein
VLTHNVAYAAIPLVILRSVGSLHPRFAVADRGSLRGFVQSTDPLALDAVAPSQTIDPVLPTAFVARERSAL